MATRKKIVGLGEVLWDILPQKKFLGGAPANFAYTTSLLGDEAIVASRVGDDELGAEAIARVKALGLSTDYIQRDSGYKTGAVHVRVDVQGIAQYEILQPSAWDFLEWTDAWRALAPQADAVCFGSLAQRGPKSRDTIRQFLAATRPEALRVFDVNLRQPFYAQEVLAESMKLADIVKMNDEEVPRVMELGGLKHSDEKSSSLRLIEQYDLKLVCVTRGSQGSLLVTPNACCEGCGVRVTVADTIGAGDAFTAALIHEYLRGSPLERMNRMANRVGAWVASQPGPTPVPKGGDLEQSLAEIA